MGSAKQARHCRRRPLPLLALVALAAARCRHLPVGLYCGDASENGHNITAAGADGAPGKREHLL